MAVQRTKPLPAQPRHGVEDGLRARILMVDDHRPNLLALEAILSPLGEELVGVTSGEDALRQLLDGEFALILMDVQMPGMDGIETAAVIKQRERNRSTPIIFLTAIAKDPSFIFKGYSQGAVDYLLKPFDPEILRTKVSVFVDLWRRGELIKRQAAMLRAQELRELERRSEVRFHALTDSMPQCVWAARRDGEIYYCNRVWREYAGADAGLSFFGAVPADELPAVQAAWGGAIRGGRGLEREQRLRRHDGELRWHLCRVVPEHDEHGAVVGWIATATDIDHQKRVEEAHAALLLREQEARAQLEEANRSKDEFLATVSHELRTPLNAILGWTRMLRTGALEGEEKLRRALETIERNARVQTQLVDDILDVSRIIAGKLRINIQKADLHGVARSALDAVRPAAEAKGVNLVATCAMRRATSTATRIACSRWCGTCSPTPSSSRRAREGWPSACSGGTAMSRSWSPIPAWESHTISCPTCSIASARRTAPARACREAWASDSPSCATWSRCTAERCGPRAKAKGREPASRSGCRCGRSRISRWRTRPPSEMPPTSRR